MTEVTFFGDSARAAERLQTKRGEGDLIMSQTLESVFEVQEAIFRVRGIGGGQRVTELGVSLVALWLADPGESDFGCVVDDDVIARANVERSQAVDEKLWKNKEHHKYWHWIYGQSRYMEFLSALVF